MHGVLKKFLEYLEYKNIGTVVSRRKYLRHFDVDFYRKYYQDLRKFTTNPEYERHFLQNGRLEGRFANSNEMILALVEEFGPLPDDFIADEYRAVNDDLKTISERYQLEAHYLRFGRREGRAYLYDFTACEDAYRIYKRSGGAVSTRADTFRQFLRMHGITSVVWLSHFHLGEFVLLNRSWLPAIPQTRIAALCLFAEHGIDRMAPIAEKWRFDPDFYTIVGTAPPEADAAERYRHWLNVGVPRGEAASEEAFLGELIGESRFPPCFDPVAYRAAFGRTVVPPHRAQALAHFVQTGFPAGSRTAVSGAGTADFYVGLARRYHRHDQNDLALEALDLAITLAPSSGPMRHARGDVLRALGRHQDAVPEFTLAAAQPDATMWSHIHAAEGLAFVRSDPDAALEQILRSAPLWHGAAPWRDVAHRVIASVFEADGRRVHTLYRDGRRDDADAQVAWSIARITAAILLADPLPVPLPPPVDGPVVIVANRDLPQCDHYRVMQKHSQLLHGGWTVEIYDQNHVDAYRPALDRARVVIFYRVAAQPAIIHAILYARALGTPTIYEIDDLIFDGAVYPDPWASFEGQITASEYAGLQQGVPLFRHAIGLCDIGLASTPALAEAIRPLVRSRTCHVLRNGVDARNDRYFAMAPAPLAPATITILYGSGTKAHNSDFTQLAAPAVLAALERHPQVRFVVAGHLRLDERFDAVSARVHRLDFTTDVDAYWEVLSGIDINLAVLAPSVTTDAKSEIKWLEAAVSAVPSIVSATRTYREILVDGEDALLAGTPDEWNAALERLIVDPDLRRRIGLNARARARANYSLDTAVADLATVLPPPGARVARPEKRDRRREAKRPIPGARPRILLIHVFFPPHLIGGATRVVRDNVDYLIDHAGSDIELAVVATDPGVELPYRTRVDAYRGVPVFRIAAPREVNMDWRPFNPEMRAPFEAILDRFDPDLVHVHCIQNLTATVVEAVRARGIPYVVTLHDAWWISDFQFLLDGEDQLRIPSDDPLASAGDPAHGLVASIARRRRLGRLLAEARARLAVSETFAALHRRAGFLDTRALPNGVSPLILASRTTHPHGRVRLGHIGNRSAHKGATLVEVVLRETQFAHLELTMVEHGREPGYARDETWGTTPVRIVGPIPQETITELYAGLDVLLAPSLWPESFGLVTREARAAGLWVVASDRGAIGEDLREGVDGYRIDVSSADDLRTVLQRMDADPDRYRVSPPVPGHGMRTSDDQGAELLMLYRTFLAEDADAGLAQREVS